MIDDCKVLALHAFGSCGGRGGQAEEVVTVAESGVAVSSLLCKFFLAEWSEKFEKEKEEAI